MMSRLGIVLRSRGENAPVVHRMVPGSIADTSGLVQVCYQLVHAFVIDVGCVGRGSRAQY